MFSLPSKYGIGDFGSGAYKFIDYIKSAGQSVWQILPLAQTGYGNSPYSSVCSYSISPYYISPEILFNKGLVTKEEVDFCANEQKYIDYGFLYTVRLPLLKKAYSRFDKCDKQFIKFKKKGEFYNYALFTSIKYASGQKHFYEWDDIYKYRDKSAIKAFSEDYAEEIDFWQFVQFEAEIEWFALKKYANDNGISVFGDLPLYCALDSVDVWEDPKVFKLSQDFVPDVVSGVPPDFFSETGQLWGNPVYNYQNQRKDGFKWWIKRLSRALKFADYIRIDHFRGLDRYYEIPFGSKDAKNGVWVKVPSEELFTALHKNIDKTRVIAEDLGIIDDGVRKLLKYTGYPGMKILLFAFNGDPENLYLPEKSEENYVCYTGTHDNDTVIGYLSSCSEWDKNNFISGVKNSLIKTGVKAEISDIKSIADAVLKLGLNSKAKIFIAPLQDILKKGGDYRINEPGTVKPQNWAIRFTEKDLDKNAAKTLFDLCKQYGRI